MITGPERAPQSVVLDAAGLRRHVALPGGGRLQILDGVDLTVQRGEFTAIVGRSGSGKTTLLATLGMLTAVQTGSLTILGTDVATMGDARRTRLRNASIGYVFQSYSLVRHLSAYRNVELPLLYGRRVRRRDRRRRVHAALDLVGLGNRRRSHPRHLSGGEQQRVAIARALVREPILILADEPTGALDVETGRQVLDVLVAATRARGCALVIVTHDETLARRADRTLVMESGLLRSARP